MIEGFGAGQGHDLIIGSQGEAGMIRQGRWGDLGPAWMCSEESAHRVCCELGGGCDADKLVYKNAGAWGLSQGSRKGSLQWYVAATVHSERRGHGTHSNLPGVAT